MLDVVFPYDFFRGRVLPAHKPGKLRDRSTYGARYLGGGPVDPTHRFANKILQELNALNSYLHNAWTEVWQRRVNTEVVIFMVGREGFEPSAIGLKVQKGDYTAFKFDHLPRRPLHTVHHDA